MNDDRQPGNGSGEEEQRTGESLGRQWKPMIFGVAYGLIFVWSVVYCLDPIRCMLLSVWGAGAGITAWYMVRRFDRVYNTHWFDPTKGADAGKALWSEVREVIDVEPLEYERSLRYPKCTSIVDFFALLILAIFFAATLRLILSFDPNGSNLKGIANWTLPAAVLALIGTVLAVFYQVRLTARTKNRTEWIKTIRCEMSELISQRDTKRDPDELQKKEADKRITKLELLLNPGEPLHRTFLKLIRAHYGIDDKAFDKETKSQLDDTLAKKDSAREWKARCIRVSNVILKNEWERVKHAE